MGHPELVRVDRPVHFRVAWNLLCAGRASIPAALTIPISSIATRNQITLPFGATIDSCIPCDFHYSVTAVYHLFMMHHHFGLGRIAES